MRCYGQKGKISSFYTLSSPLSMTQADDFNFLILTSHHLDQDEQV